MPHTPEQIVKMCEAIANGHWRRGIRPDMRLWQMDYELLAEALTDGHAEYERLRHAAETQRASADEPPLPY